MNETILNGESMDIVADNIEKLKQIFPDVFTEGKVDFEKLEAVLGNYVEKDNERYNFTWYGKSQALRLAQTPSTGTLRPCKEESKDWDTTQNLYIEGDNLEVLKLLQKSYHNKVKMIYIDPPYNTGKDFIYPDCYKDNMKNYLEMTGQIDHEGKKLGTNSEATGRYHTNWINMIYPRLKLARNLLVQDGFIAVSIADEELYNLKKIMDEIFGEDNFRNTLLVRRYDKNINTQFADNGLKTLNVGSEYILIYSKSSKALLNAVYRENSDNRKENGYWKSFWNDANRPTMRYEIFGVNISEGQWKWKQELAIEAMENYKQYQENYSSEMTLEEYWKQTGKKKKFIRKREGLNGKNQGVEHWVAPSEGILRSSNWNDILISESISNKYGLEFSSPKSPKLLQELIEMLTSKEDLILDFFAGSSSTADAVLNMNIINDSNRKFILVQYPEPIDNNNDMYKEGYINICEIGKERIRRVGEKIYIVNNDVCIDLGFKVLKLDSSNIKKWDPDYDNIEATLYDHINNFVEGRTELDVVFEIMLKYGIDLTMPIDEYTLAGKKVYSVGFGALIICLDKEIDLEIAHEITKLRDELQPEVCRVVFRDNGFKNDMIKTNVKENLKVNHFDEIISI